MSFRRLKPAEMRRAGEALLPSSVGASRFPGGRSESATFFPVRIYKTINYTTSDFMSSPPSRVALNKKEGLQTTSVRCEYKSGCFFFAEKHHQCSVIRPREAEKTQTCCVCQKGRQTAGRRGFFSPVLMYNNGVTQYEHIPHCVSERIYYGLNGASEWAD